MSDPVGSPASVDIQAGSLLAKSALTIWFVELAVMLGLPWLEQLSSPWAVAFLDAGLVALIAPPIAYRWVFGPGGERDAGTLLAFLRFGVVILIVEITIMIGLPSLGLASSSWGAAVLDATVLAAASAPFIHFWVSVPITRRSGASRNAGRHEQLARFTALFVPAIVLLAGLSTAVHRADVSIRTRAIQAHQAGEVENAFLALDAEFSAVVSDLLLLAHNSELARALDGAGAEGWGPTGIDLAEFVRHKDVYDQARFLDLEGMEIVRVERGEGSPRIVAPENLQSKADRYHFRESLRLAHGAVFVSPLDLNIERGRIQVPLKPMIRFATTVHDTRGDLRGILVLNYLAGDVLTMIGSARAGETTHLALLDGDGYWLKGARREDEWGFMYEDRRHKTLGQTTPKAWSLISGANAGQFSSDDGLFTFNTVFPAVAYGSSVTGAQSASTEAVPTDLYRWKLVSHVSPDEILAQGRESLQSLALLFVLVGGVLGAGAWTVARSSVARRRAHAGLTESQQAARESAARFESIFATAGEGIISADAEGVIQIANPAAVAVFGYSAAGTIGRSLVSLISEASRARFERAVVECLRGDDSSSAGLAVETEGLRQDGEAFPLMVRLSRVEMRDGVHLTALLRDVTEDKRMQVQLTESRKLESIGALAAGVAHEINTPTQYITDNVRFLDEAFEDIAGVLATIRPRAGVANGTPSENADPAALDVVWESADVDYLLEEIPSAVEHSLSGLVSIARIVRAMKEFSHQGATTKDPVDLNRSIETTIEVTRNEWKYVSDLELDLDPALPLVPCDGGEITQVLLNLIVNAAHALGALDEGAVDHKGTIRISTRTQGDWVELRIADDGSGIPEELRARIFDPFFTTKDVGSGTGQGLALARAAIVDRHQGSIKVESEVGVGTTFVIRLPLNVSDFEQ